MLTKIMDESLKSDNNQQFLQKKDESDKTDQKRRFLRRFCCFFSTRDRLKSVTNICYHEM